MSVKLIGHDSMGFRVWQDEGTGGVVGAVPDKEAAEEAFARMEGARPFSLDEYQKEFGAVKPL